MTDLAQNIRKLRKLSGHTQLWLADHLNVSQTAVALWENGSREPSIEIIEKMADLFEVTPSVLMGWENTDYDSPYRIEHYFYFGSDDSWRETIQSYLQELGEFLYYHRKHQPLFDMAMKIPDDDVELATTILKRLSSNTTN